nr:MAG TPA: hypothetical protein [Caudoviricetes sp.]
MTFIEIIFIHAYTSMNFDISQKIGNGNTCGNKIGNTFGAVVIYLKCNLLPMFSIIYY